jgi:hypothetical protein
MTGNQPDDFISPFQPATYKTSNAPTPNPTFILNSVRELTWAETVALHASVSVFWTHLEKKMRHHPNSGQQTPPHQ